MRLEVCNPRGPVEETLRLMRDRAAAHGVELSAEAGEGLVPVEMDPEAIQRCLVNLVDNALDACRIRPAASVMVRALPYLTDGVEYQVADSGCGMDEGIRARLFQSFFSTKGTEGTGIGLMLAKRIIDQHAGTIEVHSRPGMGTTVVVRLPGGGRP